MNDLVSVVIPVYNEEAAIADELELIERSLTANNIPHEIIVVDDGSQDRTRELVRQFEGVRLLTHAENRGTGAAIKTGMAAAQGKVVMITDGDGSYPNQEMPRLLEYMETYDMVVGARRREAGSLPWLRVPAKASIRLLASYLVGSRIPDLNSGLRCFKKEMAERYLNILPNGFSWVSTITLAFLANGHGVKFVPVDYFRRKGRSNFHPIRDTYNYLSMVVRTITYFDPLRVFLPLAAVLLLVGGGKTIFDIVRYDWHVAPGTVMVFLTGVQLAAIGLLADLIVRRGR